MFMPPTAKKKKLKSVQNKCQFSLKNNKTNNSYCFTSVKYNLHNVCKLNKQEKPKNQPKCFLEENKKSVFS